MAGAYVTGWHNNSAYSSVTSLAVTVSPTVNNLIVGISAANAGGTQTIGTPTGFTNIQKADPSATGVSVSYSYKVAAGDETTVTFTIDIGTRMAGIVAEYSGLATTTPLEDSAVDTTYIQTTGSVHACGSATPVSANGIALAAGGSRQSANFGEQANPPTIDNSYTIDKIHSYTPSTAMPIAVVASKTYTSTAAQAPSWTNYQSTAYSVCAIAVFKEPAAGGGPVFVPKVMMF